MATRLGPVATLTLLVLLVLAALLAPLVSLADRDGYKEEEEKEHEEENREAFGDLAEAMGSIAFYSGLVLIPVFILYKHLAFRLRNPTSTVLTRFYRHVLNLHILTSFLLGLLSILHGVLLLEEAGLVEYLAVATIVIILASGLTLIYTKNKRLKLYARAIHMQRLLSAILLVLLVLHIAFIE